MRGYRVSTPVEALLFPVAILPVRPVWVGTNSPVWDMGRRSFFFFFTHGWERSLALDTLVAGVNGYLFFTGRGTGTGMNSCAVVTSLFDFLLFFYWFAFRDCLIMCRLCL